MPISKRELIDLGSSSAYARGQDYFRQNRVKIIKNENGHIKAEIRGSDPGNPYQVSFAYSDDGDGLAFGECGRTESAKLI